MSEQIVSEKIVSKKIIKHSLWEKIPGYEKFKHLKNSFGGILWGILFVIAAVILTVISVKSVKEYSKLVTSLVVTSVDQNSRIADTKLVKLVGKPIVTQPISFNYSLCREIPINTPYDLLNKCQQPTKSEQISDVLYYEVKLERYEQQEKVEHKTETVTENGHEYEQTKEIKKLIETWVTKDSESKWANFSIGNVKFDFEQNPGIKKELSFTSKTIENVFIPNADRKFVIPQYADKASPQVGDTRLVIKYIPVDQQIIAVGQVKDEYFVPATEPFKTFIISNLSETDLISQLKSEEQSFRWGSRIFAVILYTVGFMMITGPILALLDFIPVFGKIANGLAFITSLILAITFVALGVFIVKYWILTLLILIVATVLAVIGITKYQHRK